VVSAEGELPSPVRAGAASYYADAYGPNGAFATFDYGDGAETPAVYAGRIIADADLSVTALGPRAAKQVKTSHLQCPNCGGDVPKLHADRSERLGCPYCGAFSDIPARTVLATQERLLSTPDIPIGNAGTFGGAKYTCLAYLRRSANDEGERYGWEEYLLFSPEVGYRWLVKDPETGWAWTEFVSPAEIDRSAAPSQLRFASRVYRLRNTGRARVDYVLGEIYWKCSLGETVSVSDYEAGSQVLSREADDEEVNYSHSTPLSWARIAGAFGLPVSGAGAKGVPKGGSSGCSPTGCITAVIILVLVILVVIAISSALSSSGGGSMAPIFIGGGNGYRGSGSYSGGK
jgi:ribosomal protein S27AE